MQAVTLDKPETTDVPPVPATVRVEVFYDGDCPLCRREIDLLRRWDKKGRIAFTDIAAAGFRASDYRKTHGELMAEIHGRLPSGEWITGVEVFRHLYGAVGWGVVARLTRLPVVKQSLDLAYSFFAKRRLAFTGRCKDDQCQVAANPRSQ